MLAARLTNALLSRIGLRLVHVKSAGTSMHDALSRVAPYVRTVKTVIDVGAARGTWTIAASKALPGKAFLAIEPLREREVDLQRLRKRIPNFDYELCVAGEAHNTAVSLSVAEDLDSSIVNDSGATKTLENTEAIVMEVYNFNISRTAVRFAEMCNYLENTGFRVFGLADPMFRPEDKALWQFDLVFLRQDASAYTSDQFIQYTNKSKTPNSNE